MELDHERTYFGEMQSVPKDLVASLWISEALIAVATLEARIARRFAILETTEEGVKGFVESSKRILLDLGVDILVLFSLLFVIMKMCGLHRIFVGHLFYLTVCSKYFQC